MPKESDNCVETDCCEQGCSSSANERPATRDVAGARSKAVEVAGIEFA